MYMYIPQILDLVVMSRHCLLSYKGKGEEEKVHVHVDIHVGDIARKKGMYTCTCMMMMCCACG